MAEFADTITLAIEGGNSIVLPTPAYGTEPSKDLDQIRSRTMSGRVLSLTRNPGVTQWDGHLYWDILEESDYSALDTFIYTDCNGTQTAFNLTDWNSVVRSVKYFGGLEKAKPVEGGWEVRILLVKVP